MATQTEDIFKSSTACQTETVNQTQSVNQSRSITPRNEQQKSIINLAPKIGKGKYPCRIGSCIMELVHGRMIGHLRYHHKDVFYEV